MISQLFSSTKKTPLKTAPSNSVKSLALYYYDGCPFCHITQQIINKTGLDVELRHIRRVEQFRKELIKHGGKSQVPCLRIEQSEGEEQWLYESQDIIAFLRAYQQLEDVEIA
ncbi:MAG: glutathione S-transferase N-terminal domain-containing protein [Pseudomonadales bacterium]|nr:glutathione S-transferase N-terminal domain-containing protein [Pseudomonadales bacterium]